MRVVPGLTIMRCVRSKPQGEAGAGEFSGSKIIPFGTVPSRFIPSREQRHHPSPAFRRLESLGALLDSDSICVGFAPGTRCMRRPRQRIP